MVLQSDGCPGKRRVAITPGRLHFSPGDELGPSCWSTEEGLFKTQSTNDVSLSYAMFHQINPVQLGSGMISRLRSRDPSLGNRRDVNNDTIPTKSAAMPEGGEIPQRNFTEYFFFSLPNLIPAPSICAVFFLMTGFLVHSLALIHPSFLSHCKTAK